MFAWLTCRVRTGERDRVLVRRCDATSMTSDAWQRVDCTMVFPIPSYEPRDDLQPRARRTMIHRGEARPETVSVPHVDLASGRA